ncbi:hypothetical protein JAAARDRAFT_40663 [Jaapia argillacea MUCL 33604]|uniref:Zn(2)-C6 fungal-type domain-containing protein n=1 Tax=Jaapia argillacea MUCL 33604 TaxID=933084 RepID=A0A067PLD6_9AGAM|nr:hypothetical protein JAAARDRAFT_40663 [Jaapia argillacea MUCL 33604]
MSEEQSSEKSSSSMLKERRFKLSRACDRCRRRRIKCDEGHPCQACLNSNSACTFEEPGKRSHPHKSKRTATLEDRMHHLESLIQAIPPSVFAAGVASAAAQAQSDPRSSPHASFASSPHAFPSGVPPNAFPLTNPSTHFTRGRSGSRQSSPNSFGSLLTQPSLSRTMSSADDLCEEIARMSLSPSYLYLDDEGYTRWQGETSCLPLLDLLVERHASTTKREERESSPQTWTDAKKDHMATDWFPDRMPKRTEINPEMLWKLVTSIISPDLMDSLVQCYLSTSYYLMPFLHVPSFLADYGNPQKWGEPGFAAFIVSICCLSSRHIDDPRVRADPNDGVSAGTQWFELFGRLRTLPSSDRPTLYTIQAVLIAGVYAVGLGKLSKAFSLLAEAVTLSIDAGLHRSADAYDIFDPIEEQVRKRTFWSVYVWDKQAVAHFGRPPMIRLRDCDLTAPVIVDDEYISSEGIGAQPPDRESRMSAFVSVIRMFIVLESVLDTPPSRSFGESSPFLTRATSLLTGFKRSKDMRDEETLLDEVCNSVPAHWAHSAETMASDDVIRVTQAERLHCVEQFVRMLIHRHRFSELVAERAFHRLGEEEQTEEEREAMRAAHVSALQIVAAHLHIATKGLMTYYGVHVIHQLTQAGRTLVAILMNSNSEGVRPLIPSALDALRSCVGLLRRFSGRYVCGLRSGDMMEEFCRLTQIPLDSPSRGPEDRSTRPPWIRPVRKKTPSMARSTAGSSDTASQNSPEADFSGDIFLDMTGGAASPPPSTSFATSPNGTSPPAGIHHTSPHPEHRYPFSNTSPSIPPPDPSMPMSPADFMAMLNDGSIDMTSIFGNASAEYISAGPLSAVATNGVYGPAMETNTNGTSLMGVFHSP